MSKKVIIELDEYNDLLKCQKAFEQNQYIIYESFFNLGYSRHTLYTTTKDEAISILIKEKEALQLEINKLKKKWWQ